MKADKGCFISGNYLITVDIIPGDGDCLFSAVSHQLFRHPVGSLMHTLTSLELRQQVADHLNRHHDKYKLLISESLRAAYPWDHSIHKMKKAKKRLKYVNELRRPGFWGGAESYAAIADIYNVEVVVFGEGDPNQISYTPRTIFYTQSPAGQILLGYRKSKLDLNVYNHYDSISDVVEKSKQEISSNQTEPDGEK